MRRTPKRRIRWSLALLLAAIMPVTLAGLARSATQAGSSWSNEFRRPLDAPASAAAAAKHEGFGAARHDGGTEVDEQNDPATPLETIDLCAKAGTISLPDSSVVDIWGFALKPLLKSCINTSVVPQMPGPVIDVTAGNEIRVNVTNTLSQNVSVIFPGQNVAPDRTGVAEGATASYTFTPGSAGTFLYEAGTNAQIQIPMGMFGAMIVRPSNCLIVCTPIPNQAYDDPSTAYDVEAVLLLSEIDPEFNDDPENFDFTDWAPKFWLMTGKAYPGTGVISAGAGQKVLIRYLNAGLDHHTMTLLGTHQREIASDAFLLTFPFDLVSETIPSGQTKDTIAVIPGTASSGDRFPLYSANLNVTNRDAYPGGMLTFITVP
jgi:FtsP/CotA-like multicopper oxidase with cupredoxin domain